MRRLKKILLALLILIVVGAGGLFVVAKFYNDQVKEMAINVLQNNLNCDIYINNIEKDIYLDVFSNFPKASLAFDNIWTKGHDPLNQDTLLSIHRLEVLFDISNLFKSDFEINAIHLADGFVHVNRWSDQSWNYEVWNADSSETNVSLNIDGIDLKNVQLKYHDHTQNQLYKGIAESVLANFSINHNHINLHTEGRFSGIHLTEKKSTIKPISVQLKSDIIIEENGKITLDHNELVYHGKTIYLNGYWSTNTGSIAIKANKLSYDLLSKIAYLKPNEKSQLNKIDGSINWYGYIKNKSELISLNGEFSTDNTHYSDSLINLENIAFKGKLDIPNLLKPSKNKLSFSEAKLEYKDLPIELSGSLTNGSWLALNGKSSGDLNLFNAFMTNSLYTDLSGNFTVSFTFSSGLDYIQDNTLNKLDISGNIKDLSTQVKDTPYQLKGFNGDFQLTKGNIQLKGVSGFLNGSPLSLEGQIINLFEKKITSLDAKVSSPDLDLESLLVSSGDETAEIFIPQNIQFKVVTDFQKMRFGKFQAENVYGSMSYRGNQLFFFPLTLNTAGGKMVLRGKLDARNEGKIEFKSNTDIVDMNLQTLFSQLNNFGQDYVTDEHIRGKGNAQIEANIPFDLYLNPIMKDVYILGDIRIDNGALINNEMLMDLSDYIDINELKDVQFSRLENKIKIKNERIYIPEMTIESSALSVTLAGEQGFDETIDYRFELNLSELIAKRARKNPKNVENDKSSKKDGMKLYLKMTGTLDDPILKYDRQELMTNIKQNLKEERQVLKEVLKEEMKEILHPKKDSVKAPKVKTKDEPVPTVEIEWEG